MNLINLTLPSGKKTEVPYGTRVQQLLTEDIWNPGKVENNLPIVAALVNNELTSLSFKVEVDASIVPVYPNDDRGALVYRRSLSFLLNQAAAELYPKRQIVISHSLGHGYFYYFEDGKDATDAEAKALHNKIQEYVDQSLPIHRRTLSYKKVVDDFTAQGRDDRTLLLEFRNEPKIPTYHCGDFWDISYQPMVDNTAKLKHFEVLRYDKGLLLRYPGSANPDVLTPMAGNPQEDNPLLYSIYNEYKAWGKIQGLHSVGRLNEKIANREIKKFIRIAEALHDKKIAEIADSVFLKKGKVKVVLIAGPSSSGKTTFTKKLAVQLRVLGFNPQIIGLDDYFVPRTETPIDENGDPDFESLRAIAVDLLNQNLLDLFAGNEVEIPAYNFKTGVREYNGNFVKMDERSILVMEGIHGLNPELTPLIPEEQKFRVYISALTQLNIDNANRIATTDNRLLRRIIRDNQFRGHDAMTTLKMWGAVKRGERKNIFPYQNNADAAFNSALDYELAVMKPLAEPLLKRVKPWHVEYAEARRILNFLKHIYPLQSKVVPMESILREFVGDSGFKY